MAVIDIFNKLLGSKTQAQGTTIKVIVDGQVVYNDTSNNIDIAINITGDVKELYAGSGDTSVQGNANIVQAGSGNIDIKGFVSNNVKTGSGSIKIAGAVKGSVETGSGTVNCGAISGNVKTGSGNVIIN